jgi:cyclopropane fatty-acyl-phospholipid synthase-like methyltransferase
MTDDPAARGDYRAIVAHYEECLARHGDSHRGVDWPNAADAATRYRVMLDVVRRQPGATVSLLDFGCGASHLYEHLRAEGIEDVSYTGLDLSPRFVELSRAKFPEIPCLCVDLLQPGQDIPTFDYIVMNGVFTEKRELSFDAMFAYLKRLLPKVFARARHGLAFNVMSKHVDWERDDLFHLPFDALAAFLREEITRHFAFRSDYGLFEYTAYLYREEQRWHG